MRAALLLALAALAASAPSSPDADPFDEGFAIGPEVEVSLGAWPTEHHDAQNSGRSPVFFNVTQYNGACQNKVSAPFMGNYYASSGATSMDGRRLYIGDSGNNFCFIDLTQGTVQKCIMLPDSGGIVSAPSVAKRTLTSDWIFIGTTAGIAYGLDSSSCFTGMGTCQVWATQIGQSVMSSPRYTLSSADNVTYPQGIVFFAGSSNNSDSNGVLLALNAANGSIIWRLNATDPVVGSYGMRFVPAIDPQRPGMGYIAYGRYVVAFMVETGAIIGRYTTILADPFASSVALPFGGDGLLVQSMSTTLWRINIVGSGTNYTLQPAWKCFYPGGGVATCHYWNTTSETWYPVVFLEGSNIPTDPSTIVGPDGGDGIAALNLRFPPNPDVDYDGRVDYEYELEDGGITLPFSTPAISPDENAVAFGTYSASGQASFIAADILIGSLRFYFNGTGGVQFGSTRSSAAVDLIGMMFIPSLSPDGETSHPVLWCLDLASESPHWMIDIGEDGDVVGPASSIVTQTITGSPLVVTVSEHALWFFSVGQECPSNSWEVECSGHGTCDCNSGICICDDPCFTGPACDTPLCGPNSLQCNKGTCTCNSCYTGPNCQTPICGPNSVNCTGGVCTCSGCYSGPTCSNKVNCGPNSWGCSNNACMCFPCWSGQLCNVPTTCPASQTCNGITGQCTCPPCFTGTNCATPVNCGGGTCNNVTGTCTCNNCFSGPQCNIPTNCSHGTCDPGSGQCMCDPFWTGPSCSQCYECNTGYDCKTVCSNRGICAMNGCDCPDGWGGDYCELQCPPCLTGSSCHVYNQCSGHGTCNSRTGCQCSEGWYGWTCGNAGNTPSPSPSSGYVPPAGNNSSNGGAIAGGVIGGLTFAGACVLIYFKRATVKVWWDAAGSSGGTGSYAQVAAPSGAYNASSPSSSHPAVSPTSSFAAKPVTSGGYGAL